MQQAKLNEYLRSVRDYCDPHPGLTKAQLLFEMERARRTLDYILQSMHPDVTSRTPTSPAET